jgi:hypothetical protein
MDSAVKCSRNSLRNDVCEKKKHLCKVDEEKIHRPGLDSVLAPHPSQLGLLHRPARGGRRTMRPNPDRHSGRADARTRCCTAPRTPKCGSLTILQALGETARMQEMWKNAEATAHKPFALPMPVPTAGVGICCEQHSHDRVLAKSNTVETRISVSGSIYTIHPTTIQARGDQRDPKARPTRESGADYLRRR